MALTSASTTAAWISQYEDNLDYDLTNSVEKCKLFIAACRILLRRVPDEVTSGGRNADSYVNDPAKMQKALEDATAWWQANDETAAARTGGGGVVTLAFGEFHR